MKDGVLTAVTLLLASIFLCLTLIYKHFNPSEINPAGKTNKIVKSDSILKPVQIHGSAYFAFRADSLSKISKPVMG